MKMQTFDPEAISPAENYKLLIGSVVPRPIAFVSSIDAAGVRNVAPYSFFTVASANPPVLCFCAAVREAKNGLAAHKDTLGNVRATGEFVVNVVSEDYVAKVNAAAAQVGPEVDEFALAGLSAVPSDLVRAPGVGESRVRMECRLLQVVEVSDLPMGGSLVLGQVVRFHIAEEVLEDGLHIDAGGLGAVGRMAGATYARTTDRFDLERPK